MTAVRAALVGAETLAEQCRQELAGQAEELAALRSEWADQGARTAGAEAGWAAERVAAEAALEAKQTAVDRLSAAVRMQALSLPPNFIWHLVL